MIALLLLLSLTSAHACEGDIDPGIEWEDSTTPYDNMPPVIEPQDLPNEGDFYEELNSRNQSYGQDET